VKRFTIRALLLAIGAFAAACSSPRIPACPGEPIGTLHLTADLRAGEGGCYFAVRDDASEKTNVNKLGLKVKFDFTATVATSDTGQTLLCLQRPEASPLTGTLEGDHLSVAGPSSAFAFVSVCACQMTLAETLEGTLTRNPDGSFSFAGTLRDALAVYGGADPAICEPTPIPSTGPQCGVPCELRWTVTQTR
jgi:hypothetical protein